MGAKEELAKKKAAREAAKALKAQKVSEVLADAEADVPAGDETFAQTKGLPANVHAKKLAQAKSKKSASVYPVFYTQKGMKVLKMIAKPGKTLSVYVGNMSPKKHKVVLDAMIAKWKKDGVWLAEHEAKDKMSAIQAEYVEKAAAKKG